LLTSTLLIGWYCLGFPTSTIWFYDYLTCWNLSLILSREFVNVTE